MEQSNSGAMKHALVILNDNQGSYISRTSQLISTCMYKLPCRNAILMEKKRQKKQQITIKQSVSIIFFIHDQIQYWSFMLVRKSVGFR